MNIVTSRQLKPAVFKPSASALIQEALYARTKMARAAALYSAAAEIQSNLDREQRLIQSFERKVSDIQQRACLRMYGSETFGSFTEEERESSLSMFQAAAVSELRNLASQRNPAILKLRARQRRIHSLLRTMNTRRFA